jgi:hypothetical protein
MQFADNEKVIADTPFGISPAVGMGGTVTLTSRRLILSANDYEESIPLSAVTAVRASYARDIGAAAWGAVILSIALAFGAGYKTLETGANGIALAIERRVTEKMPERSEAYGHYVNVPAVVVWLLMLPLIGIGGVKLGAGLLGETELVIATASGEQRRARYGRQSELMEFGEATGRAL